jgi:predicted lactoylglutathione lyase
MEPGAFSIRLAVKDIGASKAFYEKLGFKVFARQTSEFCHR